MFCNINNVFTFLIQYKIIDKKTPWIETFLVYLDIVQSNVINQSLSSAVLSQPDPDLSPLEISVAPLIKYMTYPTCFSRIRLFLWKVISVENRHFFFFLLLLLFQWLRPVPHCKRITLFSSMYLCKSWTLHIFDGLEVTGQFLPALTGQGSLFVLGQFLQSVAVVSQIHLSPDQQEGRPRAVVWNLRHPLLKRQGQTRMRHESLIFSMKYVCV